MTFSHSRDFNAERAYDYVRKIGAQHFFFTSDIGQKNMPHPVKAFELLVKDYLSEGFSPDEIRTMNTYNPEFLIGP